ncbi:MAG TPA: LysR family transcriptional regulator [Polyangiaceae bacterium]|nr:LysR family transcriptional regulator [Polyangiaceae bacterium]
MDRLESLQVFVAVAEQNGFAAAARHLGMSAPSVTRAIAALEARIGTELLKRTTRTVRLTEAGARFLTDARRILAELEEAERFAGDLHGGLRGQLGVTAPINFGRMFVAPVVVEFLGMHAQVSVRTLFVDRVVDLLDEGLDVAVRIAELPDSTLTAVRVGSVRRVLCAAPQYLAQHGRPRAPSDIGKHETIAFGSGVAEPEWKFARKGKGYVIQPRARLLVNSVDVAVAAAVAGRGLVRLLSYQVEAELHAGRLESVLPDFEPPPLPVHVVHAGGKRASAKLRHFVDLAVSRLRRVEPLVSS